MKILKNFQKMIIKNKNFFKKTFIVAEVGNNHEGCFKTAEKTHSKKLLNAVPMSENFKHLM